MGRPLFYEIMDKPATSCVIALCSLLWFYIQKNGVGYSHVGLSYQTAVEGHYWWIVTSAFSHISVLHLVFNMSAALWSLGVFERLGHLGLGVKFYLEYTLVLFVLSRVVVLGMYHVLINQFKVEYFRRVTAVGYSPSSSLPQSWIFSGSFPCPSASLPSSPLFSRRSSFPRRVF